MTNRACIRCHSPLPQEDSTSLAFCPACGAPQIRLSEELREAAQQRDNPASGEAQSRPAPPLPKLASSTVSWSSAINIALGAAAIAILLAVVAIPFQRAEIFFLLWALAAPSGTLVLYRSRHPHALIGASFGARLSLLTAALIVTASSTVNVLWLLMHHSSASPLPQFIEQISLQMNKQPNPAVEPFLKLLVFPEFSVGIFLAAFMFSISIYLALATLAGTITAAVSPARPTA